MHQRLSMMGISRGFDVSSRNTDGDMKAIGPRNWSDGGGGVIFRMTRNRSPTRDIPRRSRYQS